MNFDKFVNVKSKMAAFSIVIILLENMERQIIIYKLLHFQNVMSVSMNEQRATHVRAAA